MPLVAQKIPFFVVAPPKQGCIGPPWKQKIGIWWTTSSKFPILGHAVLPDLQWVRARC